MNPVIGFSLGSSLFPSPEHIDSILSDMLAAGCSAIELHVNPEALDVGLAETSEKLVKKFLYRSIHLPVIYGLDTDVKAIDFCRRLSKQIGAATLVLHPDTVSSIKDFAKQFETRLAIENMDWRKQWGQKVEDLQTIFEDEPNLGLVLDVNHVKTNDPSMRLGDELYQAFKDRLSEYHLSGFPDKERVPHGPLYETKEIEIIAAIKDPTIPIILEGLGSRNADKFRPELDFVLANLKF